MLNNITIHGRLTADPELKHTQSQVAFCKFTVAVDRSYTQGEEKQTDFFNCTAWRGIAETIAKFFNKGKEIVIQGEMLNDRYTDADGNAKSFWNVNVRSFDFCGNKGNSSQSAPSNIPDGMAVIEDDDIPF